nr:spidroin-2-like [Equus asinus]
MDLGWLGSDFGSKTSCAAVGLGKGRGVREVEGGDNPAPAPRPQGAGEAAGYRRRVGGGGQVVGPDSQASPRPSSPAPNHSTSVMAFGVKWNEPGEASGGECAERRAAAPGSGAKSPRRRAGPGCGCGGCTPRREPPSSPSAPARTGRGRRGRDGAVSHFPFQSKTHTHAPGRRLGPERSPAPPPRAARPRPAAAEGHRAAPGRGRGRGGRPRAHAHPPRRLPSPRSSCWPRKSASSRRGWLLTARHGRLLFSSRALGGGSKAQSRGRAGPGRIPGPGGTGDKVCRGTAGGRTAGCTGAPGQAARRARPAAAVAAAASSSSSAAGGGPLPPLPSGWGSPKAQTGSGRCVSPASPPPAPPPAVAASPSPGRRLCPRSGPGRFAAARSSLRRRPEHRALRRPPPVREAAAAAGSREARELSKAGRGSARQRPTGPGAERLPLRRRRRLASAAADTRPVAAAVATAAAAGGGGGARRAARLPTSPSSTAQSPEAPRPRQAPAPPAPPPGPPPLAHPPGAQLLLQLAPASPPPPRAVEPESGACRWGSWAWRDAWNPESWGGGREDNAVKNVHAVPLLPAGPPGSRYGQELSTIPLGPGAVSGQGWHEDGQGWGKGGPKGSGIPHQRRSREVGTGRVCG